MVQNLIHTCVMVERKAYYYLKLVSKFNMTKDGTHAGTIHTSLK